ncbi:site-specific integrase [Alloacidobacterium sp.]|uniref:tyrosine-type recombinase/integrase n=1 Tax=Alloacidobacterium sp. TaxID=2951999 RepID=UPI002D70AEF8|nr:site-specific integrase [Alloacidobacterium sp.]HYK37478.1 site-specific integrase [Alloacidobacterium sp.]
MGLIKRGRIWWYRFSFEGHLIQESTKTDNKKLAKIAEENRRKELVDSFIGVNSRRERLRLIKDIAGEYERDYKAKHEASGCVVYGLKHLTRLLGNKMVGQIDMRAVNNYQVARLEEGATGSTVNGEVSLLCRFLEERGDMLRGQLRRSRRMKLPANERVGKAYSVLEQDRLLAAAKEITKAPYFAFALQLALDAGMRSKEIRTLKWEQIDFVRNSLRVGKSKTRASSHRFVPLNGELLSAFLAHREWYAKMFKDLNPDWYIFPYVRHGKYDPARPLATLRPVWLKVRQAAGVKGRFHDARHTVVSQLGETGASTTTIKASVGHVSQQMLDRYSHANQHQQRSAFENMVEYRNAKREQELRAQQQFENPSHKPATVN